MANGVQDISDMLALAGVMMWLPAVTRAQQRSGCIGHRPQYIDNAFEVTYDSGCSGHDEPELDPVSSLAGSARELTWTVVLPTDRSFSVTATGPTFWFGGTVTDPTSLFGQAFVELQFYPDSIVTNCAANGGFIVRSQSVGRAAPIAFCRVVSGIAAPECRRSMTSRISS